MTTPAITDNATPGTSKQTTFANVTKRSQMAAAPQFTKEQGIIMQMTDNIPSEAYVYALAEVTDPRNIISYDKISNNRLRIYLKDKQTAEHITKNYKTIKVQQENIQIRRLLILSKRIIISNASPEIPHIFIENELKRLGLNPVSSINFLRAGLKKPNFEHILSSRRCLYVANDFNTLPDTTLIEYEGLLHRIFITDDSVYCTYCRRYGHPIEKCKFKEKDEQIKEDYVNLNQLNKNQYQIQQEQRQNTNLTQLETQTPVKEQNQVRIETQTIQQKQTFPSNQQENIHDKQQENFQPDPENEQNEPESSKTQEDEKSEKENESFPAQSQKDAEPSTEKESNPQDKHTKTSNKRTRSKTNSTESLNENQDQTKPTTPETATNTEEDQPQTSKKSTKNKRPRSISPYNPSEEWIKMVEQYLDKNKYKLTLDQLQNFLELAQNNNDIVTLSQNYTDDPDILVTALENIRSLTNNRSTKIRLTKTLNKLTEQLIELDP